MPSIPPGIPGGEKHIHHYLSPEPSCVSHMSAKHLGKNATSCTNQGKWNRFFSKIGSWITWEVTFNGNASPDHSIANSTRLCRAAFADISSFGLYLSGPSYSKGMPGASSTDIIRKLPEILILGHDGQSLPASAGGWSCWSDPWIGQVPWSREWQPTPVFLPGKAHGRRSLVGYGPRGHKEPDATEHRTEHTYPLMNQNLLSHKIPGDVHTGKCGEHCSRGFVCKHSILK